MRLLDGGSLPPLSMLGRQNVTHVINTPSPYLPFCTLQAIKNWTVGRRLMSFLSLISRLLQGRSHQIWSGQVSGVCVACNG